jgi:hypothetical protein
MSALPEEELIIELIERSYAQRSGVSLLSIIGVSSRFMSLACACFLSIDA